MSEIVLTHTGSVVPEYVTTCVKQLKHTNPSIPITLIADDEYAGKQTCQRLGISFYKSEDLNDNALLKEFRRISFFKSWGKPDTTYPSPPNFVQGTSERLFLLSAYLEKYEINDAWHIENDNMIYGCFDDIQQCLSADKLTCCTINDKHTVWNLAFIPKHELIKRAMVWYFIELNKGNEKLLKEYDIEMVHEMTIMARYGKLNFFPTLGNVHFVESKIKDFYFDPAVYGQFIGGTNNGHKPGFRAPQHHTIRQMYPHLWKMAGFDKLNKRPFVWDQNDNPHQIFNLHMHNKHKMKRVQSYE